ncbi:DUF6191 domain-containing protein [Streptomyces sp. NPDC048717]|uniref:DUF6191 domain-containing protein n=1 Tax=Streptomyces sp. NPDC048717 TaxID=3154928 RepID=UPI0034235932
MFNVAEEFFAPGRKHTDDERQRLALTREDLGDADPYRGPIDLASGKVTIRIPAPAGPAPAAPPGQTESEPEPGPGSDPGPVPESDPGPAPGSDRALQEPQPVRQSGGLAPAGDAELGEDVGDVDAGRLR